MVTDLQQATIADLQEKVAETHELLQREEEFERRHQVLMERRVENAIRIGQNLCDFKAALPHGKFTTFVQTEFGMSQDQAQKYMLLTRQEANTATSRYLDASPSAYIELASPSMPATVIEMVETKQIPPTVAAIREAKREVLGQEKGKHDIHVMQVMGSSESPEWYTPQEIVRLSIELLGGIDLDPCSNSHESPNVPARVLYTKEDDGLSRQWTGKTYLNPPYGSEIPQWVEKLVASYGHGVTEAIALLPARIDTVWFQPLYEFPMCNIRGRLQFSNSPHNAPFPSVIVYLGNRLDDFLRVFGHKGPIMKRVE